MEVKTLLLRPTQFALGLKEVETKVHKLKKLSDEELEAYLKTHPVPVVEHDESFHLIDHHHLVRAAWEIGIEKVPTTLVHDLSNHTLESFWKTLHEKNWIHLFDQFGNGPHDPSVLPHDIRGLADDVYRSLAWSVREEGGYEKNETPFSEFKWADFFRTRIPIARKEGAYDRAVNEAVKIAQTHEASHLPGFKGLHPPAPRGK